MRPKTFSAAKPDTRRWAAGVVVLLLMHALGANAAAETPERIAWQKKPIGLVLSVGIEQLVTFPESVKVGVPVQHQSALRVQSIAGTLYLLANQPFSNTRVVVRGIESGQVYLLDLSATSDDQSHAPLEIYLPDAPPAEGGAAVRAAGPPQHGYVTLTRFAAQQLYAPPRLLTDLPGVVRAPVKAEPVPLLRGDAVEAVPLIAWRAGSVHVTAVRLTNQTKAPHILDPRTLRGEWLTATFQHNRLHAAGSEADRTVVYLVSARPFAASLH